MISFWNRLFCILLLIFPSSAVADEAIDSLKKELIISTESPEKTAFYLNRIAYHYRKISTDSTIYYAMAAKALADKYKIKKEIGMAYNNFALANWINGNFDASLDLNLKAKEIREAIKDTTGMIQTYFNLGLLYSDMKDDINSLKYYELALKYGQSSFHLIDLDKKKRYFEEAFKIYSTNNLNLNRSFSENLSQLSKEQSQLKTTQKKQQKQLLQQLQLLDEKDHKFAKMWNIIFFTGCLLIIMSLLLVIRSKVKKKKQIQKELELCREIEQKNKELSSYTLNFIRKKELFDELNNNLNQLKKKQDKAAEEVKNISDIIREGQSLDKDWNDFKIYFEQVHKDFFKCLKNSYPDLTSGDLKLCALLKMNLNLKEAATVMGISSNSVKTARYRLKKKLNLEQDDNLNDFIMTLESEHLISNFKSDKKFPNLINYLFNLF